MCIENSKKDMGLKFFHRLQVSYGRGKNSSQGTDGFFFFSIEKIKHRETDEFFSVKKIRPRGIDGFFFL